MFPMLLVIVGTAWTLGSAEETTLHGSSDSSCDLYLAQSFVPGAGRGIFAGRNYDPEEFLDTYPTLLIPQLHTHRTLIDFYSYDADSENEDYDMIGFGPPSLFNHNENKTIDLAWNYDDFEDEIRHKQSTARSPATPFTRFMSIDYFTMYTTKLGDELFGTYGDADWFSLRGIEYIDPSAGKSKAVEVEVDISGSSKQEQEQKKRYSLAELNETGFCLSDVYIAESTRPLAGKGLFAKRPFSKGEIVTMSPVLPIKMDIISESKKDSILANYVISYPGSAVAMFPLGIASMINHIPCDDISGCNNVVMEWLNWTEFTSAGKQAREHAREGGMDTAAGTTSSLTTHIELSSLFDGSRAQLDISFVATRDIHTGEEIFLNYGNAWEREWNQYTSAMTLYTYRNELNYMSTRTPTEKRDRMQMPQFRHFTAAPAGFFPPNWISTDTSPATH